MTTSATILNKPAVIFEPKQLQLAVETVMLLQKFENDQRLNGKAEETISRRMQQLYQVGELTDLSNPEAVKTWLNGINPNTGQKYYNWETTTKIKFCDTYTAFLNFQEKKWKAPKYVLNRKLPFIPTEQEIDLLIAGCGKTTATVLQTLKETGIRIGELCNLKWIDLNIESRTLNITPEKGSNPRVLPISEKLIGMINKLSKQHSPNIFQPKKHMLREYFCVQRKELATRLNNPRLLKITFHTFRHWFGTMQYHKWRDLRVVQKLLGHKSILTTQIYENTEAALFLQSTDEWITKVSTNLQEETDLINAGFTLVRGVNETTAIYKKRK